ncbi:Spore germination protein B3 precursor [compost metagenome]
MMARKYQKYPLLFIVLTLITTGCWNRKEVNEIVIATAMGIDKAEDGYFVSVQVVDPNEIAPKKGAGGGTPITVYKEKGRTVFEAIRKMTKVSARKVYFAHLRMLLISEELARTEGIGKVIEFISRDHEFREDFYLAISRGGSAEVILKGLTPIERIPANKMYASLKASELAWSATGSLQIDELLTDLLTEGKSAVMSGIHYIGQADQAGKKKNLEVTEPYALLKHYGLAIFHKDKLVGWLDEEESKGYNFMTGKVHDTVTVISCPKGQGYLAIEHTLKSSSIQVKWHDHSPQIRIQIYLEGNVGEALCKIDLDNPDTIKQLEDIVEMTVEEYTKKTLSKSYALDTDIVGLGAAIHRSNPSGWKMLRENWSTRFKAIPVTVNVFSTLRFVGKTRNSLQDKIKE